MTDPIPDMITALRMLCSFTIRSRPASRSVWYLNRSTTIRSNCPPIAYTSGTVSLFGFESSAGIAGLVFSVRVVWAVTVPAIERKSKTLN